MYNFMNPYQPQQRQEVVSVNGENGARAYQMAANSSALLLDSTAPIVWFIQTDGAGYKTVTPYDIAPHEQPKPVDVTDLESRIARLEMMINESNSKQIEQPEVKRSGPDKKSDCK